MSAGPNATSITATFTFHTQTGKQAIKEDTFAFDTKGAKAYDSLQAMIQAQQGQAANPSHPLEGQDAPAIDLPRLDGSKFTMAKDGTRIMILDFWATWCPPCVKALPEIQKLHEWAQKEHKGVVSVYAVNDGETADDVRPFWKEHGLTIPVLMDTNSKAARDYFARAIPQTVAHRRWQGEGSPRGL